jgi:hypothetical protein
MQFNDQKFTESRDNFGFEDSLISGTKIEPPGQKKHTNKKNKEVDEKRQKIEEIQRKYDKNPNKKDPRRMTRGQSYQEPDRSKIGKLAKGNPNKHQNDVPQSITDVGVKASKITAQKRDVFKQKKGSEMISDKTGFRPKRSMEEDLIDEKLNTQTFRFTNQFKSEMDGEVDYFKDDEFDPNDVCDEEIAEEIESRSNDSPRGPGKLMNLRKNTGPTEIPSDTNPFKREMKRYEDSSGQMGTPINKPPKVPQRITGNNVFQSPANQIFTTKRQKKQIEESEKEPDQLPLNKRHSEPSKPIVGLTQNRIKGKVNLFNSV